MTPAAAAALTLFTLAAQPAPTETVGRASVIDGDTLEIRGERIRLWGVDAPESGQTCRDGRNRPYRCGQKAALYLSDSLGSQATRCVILEQDRYGRDVARCSIAGRDVGEQLVRAGWATDYAEYSRGAYAGAQREAQAAKRGIWAGSFTQASAYRRASRTSSERKPDSSLPKSKGCAVKGNINSKGERIYHSPGMRSYAETSIDTAKGEHWFCSEGDARKAGWRAPRG